MDTAKIINEMRHNIYEVNRLALLLTSAKNIDLQNNVIENVKRANGKTLNQITKLSEVFL